MTPRNMFESSFGNSPILDGCEYIKAELGGGVTVRAYVEHDPYASPDADCTEDVEAFNNDTLRYCSMTLNVYVDGNCIARGVRSLHQIGVEQDGDGTGDYLTEYANDLLGEIDVRRIVAAFAERAATAADAMQRQ